MKKVIEYLNKNYKCNYSKPDIDGLIYPLEWIFPKNFRIKTREEQLYDFNNYIPIDDSIIVSINNETLVIKWIIIDGISRSIYGYLQTYKHIPRGEPDKYGYYRRSTVEEIIKYLEEYRQEIIKKHKLDRLNKINKIKKQYE